MNISFEKNAVEFTGSFENLYHTIRKFQITDRIVFI